LYQTKPAAFLLPDQSNRISSTSPIHLQFLQSIQPAFLVSAQSSCSSGTCPIRVQFWYQLNSSFFHQPNPPAVLPAQNHLQFWYHRNPGAVLVTSRSSCISASCPIHPHACHQPNPSSFLQSAQCSCICVTSTI